jgi:Zn-dependent hydrolases, including glyoxylases
MIFRQLISKQGGCVTYVFGCTQAGELFVVDPKASDVEEILKLAESLSMKVRYVIDTHTHADHLSGKRRLAELTGARIYLHESSKVRFPVERVRDGEELKSGNVKVRFLHTPGHTPDSLSLLVTDYRRGEEPWMVMTGDTLFVGGVGRVDIGGEDSVELLFYSLKKLKELPDYVEVYPAHTSGSVCGFGISGKPVSTIGFERKFNTAFRIDDKEEFIRSQRVKSDRPAEFDYYIKANFES